MIEVTLNGEKRQFETPITIEDMIVSLGFRHQWVVVELNAQPLIKEDYSSIKISSGDCIELVRAVAGG